MRVLVTACLTLLAIAVLVGCFQIGRLARLAPLTVAVPTLALLLVLLRRDCRSVEDDRAAVARPWLPFGALGAVIGGVILLGPALTLPAFAAIALRLGARASWTKAGAAAALVLALVEGIEWAGRPLPAGVLRPPFGFG